MFDIQTEQEIKERIFKNIKSDLDKGEGSILNDIVSAISLEIINNQTFFKNGFLSSFIETARGELLDLRCKEHGVYRKQGEKSKGLVILKSDEDIEIEETILVNEKTSLRYIIKEGAISNRQCSIEAENIGSKYNLTKDNTLVLFRDNSKIKAIEITEDIIGGEDIESDEDLRKRLYFVVAHPEGVGTVTDYERWALEVDGVKIAKAMPCFYGNGTVKVIVGGENGQILDEELIKKVQNYICPLEVNGYGTGKAPIGARATITTFNKIPINVKIINLNIVNQYDINKVKEKLEENINKYLIETLDTLIYHELISVVIESYGVKDFQELLINGLKQNIKVSYDEKAILEEIVYEQRA